MQPQLWKHYGALLQTTSIWYKYISKNIKDAVIEKFNLRTTWILVDFISPYCSHSSQTSASRSSSTYSGPTCERVKKTKQKILNKISLRLGKLVIFIHFKEIEIRLLNLPCCTKRLQGILSSSDQAFLWHALVVSKYYGHHQKRRSSGNPAVSTNLD